MMCDVMKNNVKHHGGIPENHLSGTFSLHFSVLSLAASGGRFHLEGERRT